MVVGAKSVKGVQGLLKGVAVLALLLLAIVVGAISYRFFTESIWHSSS